MPHYHANRIDAPARSSKQAAMRDARKLHVAYQSDGWLVSDDVNSETIKTHGAEFPSIVRCWRPDCTIRREP